MSDTTHVTGSFDRWPVKKPGMSFGLVIPDSAGINPGQGDLNFAAYLDIVRAGAEAGFDIVWGPDHYTLPTKPEGQAGIWEGMTLLAGLAAATRGLGLAYGVLVACTGFRNPVMLAKTAEAIDDMTDAGFVLGVGAGWNRPEYDACGHPFDHRVSRFEEAMRIIAPLLREGTSTFSGTYYQTDGATIEPRGPRGAVGGPALLVGSSGDRMLRIMARHADAWNGNAKANADQVRPLIAKVHDACRDVGRDPDSMILTAGAPVAFDRKIENGLSGSDDEIAAGIDAFRQTGLHHLTINLSPVTPETVAHAGKIIAQVRST